MMKIEYKVSVHESTRLVEKTFSSYESAKSFARSQAEMNWTNAIYINEREIGPWSELVEDRYLPLD